MIVNDFIKNYKEYGDYTIRFNTYAGFEDRGNVEIDECGINKEDKVILLEEL